MELVNIFNSMCSCDTSCKKGRVPVPLGIGRAVICKMKSAVKNVGKVNIKEYCGKLCLPWHYCQSILF